MHTTATTVRVTAAAAGGGRGGRAAGAGAGAAGAAGLDPAELGPLPLGRARDALGLDHEAFDLAVQVGEIRTVARAPGRWVVPRGEIDRLLVPGRGSRALRARGRLVSSTAAAELMGIGRGRFVRLARAGRVSPVRWYVNKYRATVWLYLAGELAEYAERNPALMKGPLPIALRTAVDAGQDARARRWRERRAAQLVRDAYDAWEEAAVWAALLGPGEVAAAVPDPSERARLYGIRASLPPGRVGRAAPEQIRAVTTADDPEEIGRALVALADALDRARLPRPGPAWRPAPEPGPELRPAPAAGGGLRPAAEPGPGLPSASGRGPGLSSAAEPGPGPRRRSASGPRTAPRSEPGVTPSRWRGLRRLLLARRRRGVGTRRAGAGPGSGAGTAPRPGGAAGHSAPSSPTSVRRSTARPSSSEAARSTSAEMPQP